MPVTNSTFDLTIRGLAARARIGTRGEGAYWALRVGAAMCFIGHGAFGFITKAAWLPYFGVIGIPEAWAWKLMPLIGAVDVTVGMAVLFAPRGLPLVYMSVWALWTALLRPLSGDSLFEAVERAGNYGVPFALLVMTSIPRSLGGMLRRLDGPASHISLNAVFSILKWTTVLLLAGHGFLGAVNHKATLTTHYTTIGLPATTTALVGWFEIALAGVVAVRPAVGLLLFVAAWKIATESLFVVAGAPVWEFVERAGSYMAPLALAALIRDFGNVTAAPTPRSAETRSSDASALSESPDALTRRTSGSAIRGM